MGFFLCSGHVHPLGSARALAVSATEQQADGGWMVGLMTVLMDVQIRQLGVVRRLLRDRLSAGRELPEEDEGVPTAHGCAALFRALATAQWDAVMMVLQCARVDPWCSIWQRCGEGPVLRDGELRYGGGSTVEGATGAVDGGGGCSGSVGGCDAGMSLSGRERSNSPRGVSTPASSTDVVVVSSTTGVDVNVAPTVEDVSDVGGMGVFVTQ